MIAMGRNPDVDAWFARYDNPLKPVMQRVREIVLDADARIGESVKWSTPTFEYRGNLASFQPRSKRFASLLVHTGATIPGNHPILEGDGPQVRIMRFTDVATVESRRDELAEVVRAWCDTRDAAS
jgi:hypothetical protein